MELGHLDWDMGKYVVFVWGCYGATAVALAALIIVSLRAQSKRRKVLEALQAAVETK